MNTNKHKSLRFSLWFLGLFISRPENNSLFGDIEEMYQLVVQQGRGKATILLWSTIFKTVLAACYDALFWRYVMFKNYLKVGVRNSFRNKSYTCINIAGLAVGMTCCILMLLWVDDELSWDRFHEHADSICRVIAEQSGVEQTILNARTPDPLAPLLQELYPEIKKTIANRATARTIMIFVSGIEQ